MGRKLFAAVQTAGFSDLSVKVFTSPDTTGRLRPMVTNMAKYARLSGEVPEEDVVEVERIVAEAVENGRFLAASPQFVVTGTKRTG